MRIIRLLNAENKINDDYDNNNNRINKSPLNLY